MIVLDTNIYIYLSKTAAAEHHRAAALIAELQERDVPILIPTVCVAEYLTGVPAAERQAHLQALGEIGTVVPFDVTAALIAAEIHANREAFLEARATSDRRAVLADIKALATALAHGAAQMYTHNVREMKALAKGVRYPIRISGIPEDAHAQLDLVDAIASRRLEQLDDDIPF